MIAGNALTTLQINKLLARCPNWVFFYPCSGDDLEAIQLFAPVVSVFWFVDVGYFSRGLPNHLLAKLPEVDFKLIDRKWRLPDLPVSEWLGDRFYKDIPPYIWTETYLHKRSNKEIEVNFHRRRGPSALRKEIPNICVFYFRGTSSEGSTTEWLTPPWDWKRGRKPLMEEVIENLDDGGLVVTDGSMCYNRGNNPYIGFLQAEQFKIDLDTKSNENGDMNFVVPFVDRIGNRFECVGYAGERWGRSS